MQQMRSKSTADREITFSSFTSLLLLLIRYTFCSLFPSQRLTCNVSRYVLLLLLLVFFLSPSLSPAAPLILLIPRHRLVLMLQSNLNNYADSEAGKFGDCLYMDLDEEQEQEY